MADSFGPLHIYLQSIGQMEDADIPLGAVALALAATDMPGLVLERYHHYLTKLTGRVRARHDERIASGAVDDVNCQLAALKYVLVDQDGYAGDTQTYDHLDNANLVRVIDRRRGLPIALAILYIDAGRGAGFDIEGLAFPGHFLIRLQQGAQRLIIDAFDGGRVLGAPEMRALIKKWGGESAELSTQYYDPASNRDILIRLQNNIKLRQIAAEDYEGALRTVERMRLINPEEFRLLLDAGVLYSRTGHVGSAIRMIEEYLVLLPPHHRNRSDVVALLDELRGHIH